MRPRKVYLAFAETEQSKLFPNQHFGYWKIVMERPLRLHSQLTIPAIESLRFASGDEELRTQLYEEFGDPLFDDFDSISKAVEKYLAEWGSGDDDGEDEEGSKKGLSEKKRRSCWTVTPGSGMPDWLRQQLTCAIP